MAIIIIIGEIGRFNALIRAVHEPGIEVVEFPNPNLNIAAPTVALGMLGRFVSEKFIVIMADGVEATPLTIEDDAVNGRLVQITWAEDGQFLDSTAYIHPGKRQQQVEAVLAIPNPRA